MRTAETVDGVIRAWSESLNLQHRRRMAARKDTSNCRRCREELEQIKKNCTADGEVFIQTFEEGSTLYLPKCNVCHKVIEEHPTSAELATTTFLRAMFDVFEGRLQPSLPTPTENRKAAEQEKAYLDSKQICPILSQFCNEKQIEVSWDAWLECREAVYILPQSLMSDPSAQQMLENNNLNIDIESDKNVFYMCRPLKEAFEQLKWCFVAGSQEAPFRVRVLHNFSKSMDKNAGVAMTIATNSTSSAVCMSWDAIDELEVRLPRSVSREALYLHTCAALRHRFLEDNFVRELPFFISMWTVQQRSEDLVREWFTFSEHEANCDAKDDAIENDKPCLKKTRAEVTASIDE